MKLGHVINTVAVIISGDAPISNMVLAQKSFDPATRVNEWPQVGFAARADKPCFCLPALHLVHRPSVAFFTLPKA
jgi:hypothetical protein